MKLDTMGDFRKDREANWSKCGCSRQYFAVFPLLIRHGLFLDKSTYTIKGIPILTYTLSTVKHSHVQISGAARLQANSVATMQSAISMAKLAR